MRKFGRAWINPLVDSYHGWVRGVRETCCVTTARFRDVFARRRLTMPWNAAQQMHALCTLVRAASCVSTFCRVHMDFRSATCRGSVWGALGDTKIC